MRSAAFPLETFDPEAGAAITTTSDGTPRRKHTLSTASAWNTIETHCRVARWEHSCTQEMAGSKTGATTDKRAGRPSPARSVGNKRSGNTRLSRQKPVVILSIPPEVLFLLIESPLQSASVYAPRCSGSLLFRIMMPRFCVTKRYLPSRRNLRRSAPPGDASVLLTSWIAKAISGRYFKRCLRMPSHLW